MGIPGFRTRAALVPTLALILAACGGGSSDGDLFTGAGGTGDDDTDEVTGDVEPVEGDATTTTLPGPLTRELDKVGWWDGFEMTAHEVVATADDDGWVGGRVFIEVDVTWLNLGEEAAWPTTPSLLHGGQVHSFGTDGGQVAGLAVLDGTLRATVDVDDEDLDTEAVGEVLDEMSIVFGEASDNQTIIPLDEATPVDSREPEQFEALAGTVAVPLFELTVSDARLEPSYQSGDRGKLLLSFDIAMSCGAECREDQPATSVQLSTLTLLTPEGGAPLSASDQSTFCCATIGPSHSLEAGRRVAFEIPEDLTGTYVLQFNPTEDDKVATLEFTI